MGKTQVIMLLERPEKLKKNCIFLFLVNTSFNHSHVYDTKIIPIIIMILFFFKILEFLFLSLQMHTSYMLFQKFSEKAFQEIFSFVAA